MNSAFHLTSPVAAFGEAPKLGDSALNAVGWEDWQ